MQVASLPTVAGRGTLQVMMQGSATGAGGGGLGQGLICLIGRGRCPRVFHTGGLRRRGR